MTVDDPNLDVPRVHLLYALTSPRATSTFLQTRVFLLFFFLHGLVVADLQ